MVGKRAKILSLENVEDLLVFAAQTRHPLRNQVLVLLSVKAGLWAGEIANLTWQMVIDPIGEVSTSLELQSRIAKKGSGRVIPIHSDLHSALVKLASIERGPNGPVIQSERGGSMTPVSIVCWFARAFRAVGLGGLLIPFRAPHFCHPGRPTGPPSRWLVAGRSTACRAQIDPDYPTLH